MDDSTDCSSSERPQFLDYVGEIFTEFDALHGDRLYGDDGAMIGGLARFDGQPVMIVGQHRGRSTREKLQHNFGMSNRKVTVKLSVCWIWRTFNLPVFTFIDTMGAYPVEVQKSVVRLKRLLLWHNFLI